jgi:hypothetical protein
MITLAIFLAAASPCDGRILPEGPIPAGFLQADFGVVRRACPRTEAGLTLGGRAIIEQENFYAHLRGGARVDVSAQPFRQLELFATSELLVYDQVIQSFRATHIGLGDTSVGATLLAFGRDSFALSVMTRADLPTALGYYRNTFPVGLEAGLLYVIEPVEDLRLHGGLLGATSFALSKAPSDDRAAIIANAGLDAIVFEWMAFNIGVNGQALYGGALDHIALVLGPRFAVGAVGIEVGAVIPVAGDERNLASFALRGAYRFE